MNVGVRVNEQRALKRALRRNPSKLGAWVHVHATRALTYRGLELLFPGHPVRHHFHY